MNILTELISELSLKDRVKKQGEITKNRKPLKIIKKGKNPYNNHNFWIVFYDENADKEYALTGVETEKEAKKDLKNWTAQLEYKKAKVVDYDPNYTKYNRNN